MNKKVKVTYRIRPEISETLINYATSTGKPQSSITNMLIDKYLSNESLAEKLKQQKLGQETILRKDWMYWKTVTHYLSTESYEKIKILSKTSKTSVSEVMDNIYEHYLHSLDSQRAYQETIDKVFK